MTSGPIPTTASAPIDWTTRSASLRAESLVVTIDDVRYAAASDARLHSDAGTTTYRTLEADWSDAFGDYRIYFYLDADEASWWVRSIAVRAGPDGQARAGFAGPLARTRRGDVWRGDLSLVSVRDGHRSSLEARGLELVAFLPGTGPGPLKGCTHAAPTGNAQPLDLGEPLAGLEALGRAPAEAAAIIRDRGVCFTFRYGYPFVTGGGYSERWCEPPPRGTVTALRYLDDGEVVVFVEDRRPRAQREQPPQGWGCPSD